jgi:MoaA/NifB/PqqE/SkfB family radical SAM enzyme
MNKFKKFKRDILEHLKLRETTLIIDIINACPLKCPSCPVGIYKSRDGNRMSIDLYKKILDKAVRECKIHHIQIFAFSDACLHPDLHLFILAAKERGLRTYISTMLQTTKCDFEKVIEARPEEFRVSFPGWNKMEYYQKGATPERFDKKFEEICKLPRYPETYWHMVFHWYNDNLDEFPRVKQLAKDNNFKLTVMPCIFMNPEKIVSKDYSEKDLETISHLLETPEECIAGMKNRIMDYCQCWDQIYIDANGDVRLCQLVYEGKFKLMSFMDNPVSKIRKAIRNHPFCPSCIKTGINAYNELYDDFTVYDDSIGDNDRFHKKERFIPR